MQKMLTFVGITGSLRTHSRNKGLLRCARDVTSLQNIFDIADISQLPFYNADIQEKPLPVLQLVAQVERADALVLACTEYNYSLAPALKNALDWLSRESENKPLNGKPVAIMGAGGGMGSSRAQYHLRQVCVYLNLHPLSKPEVFSNAFSDSFDENGDVIDPILKQQIALQMAALTKWCQHIYPDALPNSIV